MNSPVPPAVAAVVDTTDWAALRHARGPAVGCPPYDGEPVADVPDLLHAALHPDARTAAEALDALTLYAVDEEGAVRILSFVPSLARFAAALLDDPRTLRRIPHLWGPPGRDQALRTALLGGLAAEAAWHERNTGNPPRPPAPPARSSSRCARPCSRRWHSIWPLSRWPAIPIWPPTATTSRVHHPAGRRLPHTVKDWGYDTRGLIPEPVDWDVGGCTDDLPF
ncbi:hypothetical protein GCM10023205_77160 [Yinghuangia aomiensis]|uniref:Uncharacterized protein n=1 Tax=Yinghuangia aomiensis TaxID=676205 RepID=A0ABP9IAI2_9ACTN